jgi:hypothetical protein
VTREAQAAAMEKTKVQDISMVKRRKFLATMMYSSCNRTLVQVGSSLAFLNVLGCGVRESGNSQ